jgi:hypothetical protein
MKIITFFVLLVQNFGVVFAIAAADDPKIEDFLKATKEEATAMMRQPRASAGSTQYAEAAMLSRRLDLIEACLYNPYTGLSQLIKALPASEFKTEVVLMLLRTEAPIWPRDGELTGGIRHIQPLMREPFKGVIEAYLPKTHLGDEFLETRAARLALHDQLLAAVAESKLNSKSAERQNNKKDTAGSELSDPIFKQGNAGQSSHPQKQESPAEMIYYAVGMVALIALAAFLIKRSSK